MKSKNKALILCIVNIILMLLNIKLAQLEMTIPCILIVVFMTVISGISVWIYLKEREFIK